MQEACVHGNEGTCHPLEECDSLMCFNSFKTTTELYGTEEEGMSGCDTHSIHFSFNSVVDEVHA